MTSETKLFIFFEILLLFISIQQLSTSVNNHQEVVTYEYREKEIKNTIPRIENKIVIENKTEIKKIIKKTEIKIDNDCIEEWRGNEDD